MTTKSKLPVSVDFCKSLFSCGTAGTDFFDKETMEEVLGIKLPEFSPIPFSIEELVKAKSLGHQLIWYPAKDAKNKPITMARLYDKFKNKAPMGGKLLRNINWYQENPFFTTDTVRTDKSGLGSWRLVSKTCLLNTKGQNYLNQTIIATNYVCDTIFEGNPPEELKVVLAEPYVREKEIATLVKRDWRVGAELLVSLKLNQNFRDNLTEAFIRIIINQVVKKIRLLEDEYSWTNACDSSFLLVRFGGADAGGAGGVGWLPCDGYGDIGFVLSRGASES